MLTFRLIAEPFGAAPFPEYQNLAIGSCLGWLLLFTLTGLYRSWLLNSRTLQVIRIGRTVVLGVVFILVGLFGFEFIGKLIAGDSITENYIYGAHFLWIFVYGAFVFAAASFFRMIIYLFLRYLLTLGYGASRILILGATDSGIQMAEQFQKSPERGLRAIGFMDERYQVIPHDYHGFPVLGKYSDLARVIREKRINGIVISHDSSSIQEITRVLAWLCDIPIHIYVIPGLYDVVHGHFKANLVYGFELRELFAFNMPPWQVRVKRLMDLCVASFLLLCSSPLILAAAIAVKLDSKGPVFYSQERVGLYGRLFTVHKFRTMFTDAEKNGPQWATKSDSRITRVGHILRRMRIDELPQLFCVLKGDMSMVGPRPERAFFIEQLRKQVPFYISRLKMKPGLTGWAQVRHHYDTSIEDVQKKLQYDMYYYENMSLLLDIQILFRTIYVVLTGKGAQ
jgi:exopolysaccharide biosynthesis polyprenyl glycosylphosphotransferase